MNQTVNQNQNVQVSVYTGRRRRQFPLLAVIGFVIAVFWPMALFPGLLGSILEAVWLVVLSAIWGVVLLARNIP